MHRKSFHNLISISRFLLDSSGSRAGARRPSGNAVALSPLPSPGSIRGGSEGAQGCHRDARAESWRARPSGRYVARADRGGWAADEHVAHAEDPEQPSRDVEGLIHPRLRRSDATATEHPGLRALPSDVPASWDDARQDADAGEQPGLGVDDDADTEADRPSGGSRFELEARPARSAGCREPFVVVVVFRL